MCICKRCGRIYRQIDGCFSPEYNKRQNGYQSGCVSSLQGRRFDVNYQLFFAANHNVIGSIKVEENYRAYEKLETGELNFAIIKSRLENIQKSWVKYEVLCSENLNVLISRKNPYAQRKVIELSELGQFSLLTGDQDSHFYNEMRELYEKNHIDFNVAFLNTGEVDMMLDMVKDNIGISLVTDSVGRAYENEEIAAIPIEPKQEILTFLAYPKKAAAVRRIPGI